MGETSTPVKHPTGGSSALVSGHHWTGIRAQLVYKELLLFLIALIGSLSLCDPALSQDFSSSQNSPSDYTLRIKVNLVVLSATVVDRHGVLVSGLDKQSFQVYENRVLQQIKNFSHEDVPVTVGLVVDNSGSMGPKRADVIAAALSFARSSNPQDQMFVVNFNENVTYGLPAKTLFTDRQDQLQLALLSIKTIGETALYDGIAAALERLNQGNADKKVLILISDGGDNASKRNLGQVIEMAKHSAAIIYAIGIFDEQDGDQNPGVLRRFARETGGEAFFPESSKEITPICEGIARDIRNQYTLAYAPTIGAQDNKYRAIEVDASAPGHGRLSVRTRTGYSLPSAPPEPGRE
ncbi:MAG: VWA domain-containing protein [Terracidiphilus sp.]|jgi:VWFA-related protein